MTINNTLGEYLSWDTEVLEQLTPVTAELVDWE